MLLHRAEKLPEGGSWVYELKLDGFRAQGIKTGGLVHLRSRNDKDFTLKYPAIVQALTEIPDETVIETPQIVAGAICQIHRQAPGASPSRPTRLGFVSIRRPNHRCPQAGGGGTRQRMVPASITRVRAHAGCRQQSWPGYRCRGEMTPVAEGRRGADR